jgi:hypothetical protein
MSEPRRARPSTVPVPEVRRVQATTWAALVVITSITAGAFLLDRDASPVAQGLLAMVAALETMIALSWWRSARRRDRR